MLVLRPAAERGVTDLGWLDSRHTFSFGELPRPQAPGLQGDLQLRPRREARARGLARYRLDDRPRRFLQVWIVPERTGLPPSYEQKTFTVADKRGRLKLIGSNDAREDSIAFAQDVAIYASILQAGDAVEHRPEEKRGVWVQIARGSATVDGERLDEGDGAALVDEASITVRGATPCELLLFDLA